MWLEIIGTIFGRWFFDLELQAKLHRWVIKFCHCIEGDKQPLRHSHQK